ncbi:MAG: ATP-binding cassette protein [Segetibacter sp.]|jgi:lipopolysaccharide transport system ATP-binding protein|nr:ATP-binding cassette protein [Segetibacter sp.]
MESTSAIEVKNLSKIYRIGLKEQKQETLTGTFLDAIKKPVRNFRKIKNLKNNSNHNDEDVFWALKDISFTLQKGEILGIIGSNGAGKSTLLKLLSRITYPSAGKIECRGKVASLLEVGTGFNPDLTGRENVYLNGTILGLSKREIDERFAAIVEFSGIEKFIETPVKRYSSGMKVRLAFAVAAHLEPEVLIIDEVLAVGDADFQRKCIGKMQEISDGTGRTVLFVSHNMAAVKSLCTRGIVLKSGQKVFDGSQTDAINFYQANLDNAANLDYIDNIEDAPGNEFVRIINFRIKPLEGKILSITSGVDFEVLLYNYVEKANLDITFELRNSEEIIVFHTGTYITTNNDSRKGFYRVTGTLPPHLLNSGLYFFSIIIGQNQKIALFKGRDMVSFEVIHEAQSNHMRQLPGVVSPKLCFKTSFEER